MILFDEEATLHSISYVQANAPRHDLVETPDEWPGFKSDIEDLAGPPRTIMKPRGFWDPNGEVPDFIELRFVKPPILEDWTDEE